MLHRRPADSVLYRVIETHLEPFLTRTAGEADGRGLPGFVRREFEAYLRCGTQRTRAKPWARGCAFERLVPFSCKGRGFCPSCGGRQMTERAAHLVEAVLPRVPVRQWVLTLPYRLRYRLAWAQDRLQLRADGRVLVRLKQAWRDGTTRLAFEPLEFLAKLAALTPRSAINLLLYHGVLAPPARWRREVVAYGRAAPEAGALRPAEAGPASRESRAWRPRRNWTWAALMRRAFALDVLACPRCGARLRVGATSEDPSVVPRILASLGLPGPGEPVGPGPPAWGHLS